MERLYLSEVEVARLVTSIELRYTQNAVALQMGVSQSIIYYAMNHYGRPGHGCHRVTDPRDDWTIVR